MSPNSTELGHDDVFAKMDALLKKHYAGTGSATAEQDFPVLTEIVEERAEFIPVLSEVVEAPAFVEAALSEDEAIAETSGAHPESAPEGHAQASDSASPGPGEEALASLDRQIQEILEQHLSPQIVAAMDKALSSMLDKFALQMEYVVRDAVAQELRKQLAELAGQDGSGDKPE